MSSAVGKPVVHPLLAQYLVQLATNPLRTKALTSATFSFLQEVIGSNVAGVPIRRPSKDASALSNVLAQAHINSKAIKMAMYGFFVSAPLGHILVGLLQRAFAGKTGTKYRIAQILASNLLVAPIQTSAFLSSMAVINGAKSLQEVIRTVKGGFFSVIRITWLISPISMTIAQRFVPVELWVPFFNLIQFTLGTYFNIRVKKIRLAAAKKEQEEKERGNQGSKSLQ
ncbi:hypothetical protein SERLA73DRAFT_174137 [Serpula lacrymans var. lacrymans S7.3]|uniref:Integral membrane protein n=2 Tax=Serpula lacrymans var. lacrymans TaxID=341189 RepID=F8PIC9_SERL3|nr:uncharacterized protein SERLADRAFT_455214 [Serpula lacrymans var. lacrymans S7.9]EGO05172.1 hypothetical protein SERLA73DRAFT_174137 [Serpula lacrymans var. lacrymans S7.3]EGO30912.1 hypothetical protein SERLADRAFT_455214 [Serpula lacrymans var. lacrymans S7.9]